MSSTEIRRLLIVTAGYISVAFIIYLSLVASDVVADIYLKNIDGRKAVELEHARACKADYDQIDEARKLGYQSLLYPDLFDQSPYKSIAEKYNIAPLASAPNVNLYYCNEGYGQVRYKSDRYGFRNPDSHWDNPIVDAVLIGDSFVQGACVDSDRNISGILISKGLNVLNLGTGGNSPIHYAALAKTFLKIKKSNHVVLVFYPNDNVKNEVDSIYNKLFFKKSAAYFSDEYSNTGTPKLSRNLEVVYSESNLLIASSAIEMDGKRTSLAQQCLESKKISARLQKFLDRTKEHLFLKSLRALKNIYLSKLSDGSNQLELPYGSKLAIDTLQKECLISKCNPIVVYIPNSSFWRPDVRAKQYSILLKEYAENRQVGFLDVSSQLGKIGQSAYAIDGPHLSPDGYQAVAEAILMQIGKLSIN